MNYVKLGNSDLNVSQICLGCMGFGNAVTGQHSWTLGEEDLAEKNNFAKFISVQNHYNLIFREEERELKNFCAEENIAMTPYSALASGRLSKKPGETSKRLEQDSYAKSKYDSTAETDSKIISRVIELAEKYSVSMTEISLAWL